MREDLEATEDESAPSADTELAAIRREPRPRSLAFSRRLAWRIDSIFGFIVMGGLWFFAALGVGVMSFLLAEPLLARAPDWYRADAAFAVLCVAFALGWLPFGFWVRSRRRASQRLFREGELVTGEIQRVHEHYFRGSIVTRVVVAFVAEGREQVVTMSFGGRDQGLAVGDEMPVLYLPGSAYCAGFSSAERAVPAAF